MKFSINQVEFQNALSIVLKGVSTRSTLAVLSGILLDARRDRLVMQTTDLELSIQYSAAALVEETGKVVVPGKLFFDIIKSLPDGAVYVEADSDQASLACGAASFSIKTLSSDDFPAFPEVEASQCLEIPFPIFSTMIKRVARVVSKDESRAVLTGVLITLAGGKLRMVATDSYRLAITEAELVGAQTNEENSASAEGEDVSSSAQTDATAAGAGAATSSSAETTTAAAGAAGTTDETDATGTGRRDALETADEAATDVAATPGSQAPADEEFEAVIAGSFLSEIASLPKTAAPVTLGLAENQIIVKCEDTVFINRRIEGKFPNYKQLLPETYTTRALLDVEHLNAGVRRTSLLGSSISPVKFDLNVLSQTTQISAAFQDVGAAQEVIPCEVEGEDVEIAFNHTYVLDGLAAVEGENVYLEIQSPLKPGIFRAAAPEENYLYLVMPVRIS